ncbi:MAG: HAD family hydrolase [Firmicutes bacterium]|nr:HAD family hydrolase [Bacillota bacterium]
MKTLYVSDLDGTLLRSNETTSDYTNQTINELVERGMTFSYATARSFHTSHKVTKGLNARIPLIIYNGTMVVDNKDGSFLLKNFFDVDGVTLIQDLLQNDIFPIVYAFIEGEEKFSYIRTKCSPGMKMFIDSRENDKRANPVQSIYDLLKGEIFYITCIDEEYKLEPLFEKYKDRYHCVFQVDIYTKQQWLEIMPKQASKANAIKQLKEHLGCDRIVAFGDGINDIDMFEIADEAYAVENAVSELKQIATAVIGSNNDDGVAKWMLEHYQDEKY